MLRYIIGGVALGAIGFGLGKYFSESGHYCDYLNQSSQNPNDEIDKSTLQDKFLEIYAGIENLQRALPAILEESGLRKFMGAENAKVIEFSKDDEKYKFALICLVNNSKRDTGFLDSLSNVLNNILLKITQKRDDKKEEDSFLKVDAHQAGLIYALVEANNKFVTMLRQINEMKDIDVVLDILHEWIEIYENDYFKKAFA
ncbi:hypothetical protein [Campylobacter concisus]|uniref:hypothetical protein n=1 Tax=Campylobacter concisus TaxID=199 RepID=UPI00122C4E0C|nr:hypothetical protein [Campylobacter concisus]